MKKTLSIFFIIFFLTKPLIGQERIKYKIEELIKNSGKLLERERIRLLSKIYMDYLLQTYPEFGAFIGKPSNKSEWTDFSLEAIEQRKIDRSIFLKGVQALNRTNLDTVDQLTYDLLKNALELEKEGEKFPSELMPVNQISGYHQMMMNVSDVTTFKTQKDIDDFVSQGCGSFNFYIVIIPILSIR